MQTNKLFLMLVLLILMLSFGVHGCSNSTDLTDGDVVETEQEVDGDAVDGDVVETEQEVDSDAVDGDVVETEQEVDGDAVDGDVVETEQEVDDDAVDGDEVETEQEVDDDITEGEDEEETNDPCDPNPCNAADHRVCEAGTGSCLCDSGYCDIDHACVADDTVSQDHDCAVCDSNANKMTWSPLGITQECRASVGVCDVAELCDGIDIDCPTNLFALEDTPCDDDNLCNGREKCDFAGSCQAGDIPIVCVDGKSCTTDNCDPANGLCYFPINSNNCLIEDTCYQAGDTEPGNICEWCQVQQSQTGWTARANGTPCPNDAFDCTNDICSGAGACVHNINDGQCLIAGVCVAEGTSQDADGCIACDPDASKIDWSNMDGAVCAVTDDGKPCTDDVCDDGVCIADNDDSNSCIDIFTCTDTECVSGDCVASGTNAGCFIDVACYAEDAIKASTGDDSCQACVSQTSWDSWTGLDSGSCDDDDACTLDDTCSGGTCDGTSYNCNSHGTCNSDDDICTCTGHYGGDFCDQCAAGFSGYPNCISNFMPIVAETFWMGAPQSMCPAGYPGVCAFELGRNYDELLHEVILTYNFEMSSYETMQREFEELTGWNPSSISGTSCGSNCPVETVSWYDTMVYANQLSQKALLTECYVFSNIICDDGTTMGANTLGCMNTTQMGIESATVALALGATKPQDCEGYRLPTEAEWEYSIRAGQYTAFYQSEGNDGTITYTGYDPIDPNLDQIAWYHGNDITMTINPVGQKESNAWGLYDMSGNVTELVWDNFCSYNTEVENDPDGSNCEDTFRASRNCAVNNHASECRSARRHKSSPATDYNLMGFRLCRSTGRIPCFDGEKNNNETDIDCGGSDCEPCEDHKDCALNDDCESGVCTGDVCQAPTCDDSVKNNDETDVDCGGSDCVSCETGKNCIVSSDCESMVCNNNTCQAPTCNDSVQNGVETDVDCGGSSGCQPCEDFHTCIINDDCLSGLCETFICTTD